MATVHLTQRAVDAARARRRTILWDDTVRGFGLSVEPTGRRSFVVRYLAQGRDRRMVLADASQVTLAHARKLAADVFLAVAEGRDPMAERASARGGITVAEAFEGTYFPKHAARKKTGADDRRRFDKEIAPFIGKRRLDSITRVDLIGLLDRKADAPVSSNRLQALIGVAWKVFERHGLIEPAKNAAIRLPRHKERPRTDYLTLDELAAVGVELRKIIADPPRPGWDAYARGLLVQPMVGARFSELFAARTGQVRPDAIELPDTKAGEPQTIPIGQGVFGWLAPLLDRSDPEAPIFPFTAAGRPAYHRVREVWAYASKRAGIRLVSNHALRHTAGAHAAMAGMSRDEIGGILRHSKASAATKVYVHIAEEHTRANATALQDRLGQVIEGSE